MDWQWVTDCDGRQMYVNFANVESIGGGDECTILLFGSGSHITIAKPLRSYVDRLELRWAREKR